MQTMQTIQNIDFDSKSNQPVSSDKIEKISTNENRQATTLQLCACNTIPVRTFHMTYITFCLCFFEWFCTTNIYYDIKKDPHLTNLTLTQHHLAGALSVTSTIFFRVIISHFCFKYGSKISYIIVLICTAFSLIALALIESSLGYIICHVFLGISGASFVVTQYHTTRMFSDNIVGQAQAMTAGFGNFGGGCANLIMPLLIYYTNLSWRWYMIIFASISFVFCFFYYYGTKNIPQQPADKFVPNSLIETQISQSPPPDKQIGGNLKDVISDYRVWILFCCYAACFGVEITFYIMAAAYFQSKYNTNQIISGLIVFIWSSVNIFARPFGGYLSDKYNMIKRVKLLFYVLFLQSLFIILFGAIGDLSIYLAIISSLLFSVCVNMAEGIVYNIVPFIQSKSIGHVIGIVGSGGNLGSTLFMFVLFLPFEYDQQYPWIILGIIVMIISFLTLTMKFTERELHDCDHAIKECYDLETIKATDEQQKNNFNKV